MSLVRPTTGAAAYAADLTRAFEAELDAFVDGLPDHRELVTYAVADGHRTRPVGCLLSCAAGGGDWRDALGVAVGVELLHKSSVIRDDICDDDRVRGARPAFHVAFDVSRAIAVSDRLLTLGLVQIGQSAPAASSSECLQAAADVLAEMAGGQLEDIDPSPDHLTIQQRLDVAYAKTGSLSGLACGLGAIVAGAEPLHVEALSRYGRHLGTAFQILNDVRNVSGTERGREPGSDLRNARDTVLSAHARERVVEPGGDGCTSSAARDDKRSAGREELLAAGVVEYGERLAEQLLEAARQELRGLPSTPAGRILEALTLGLLRDHAF